jgi:hypothetical protein
LGDIYVLQLIDYLRIERHSLFCQIEESCRSEVPHQHMRFLQGLVEQKVRISEDSVRIFYCAA